MLKVNAFFSSKPLRYFFSLYKSYTPPPPPPPFPLPSPVTKEGNAKITENQTRTGIVAVENDRDRLQIGDCYEMDLRGSELCYYCTAQSFNMYCTCSYLVCHCFLCFQFVEITAQVMATVIVAPSCVSVRVSGCRIFLKFTLAPKKAIVVRLKNYCLLLVQRVWCPPGFQK